MSPRGDEPDDVGFLTRWSRRKRELAEPDVDTVPPVPPASALPAETAPQAAETPPEMIEPPSLDLIDKDFDVAHWLKQNVPESWKLAALRRAWESDPQIAGFENPARDYALDWNTPGGAPGYGPLSESDDVEAMLRGIFGDDPAPETEPAKLAEATSDSLPHRLSSNADGSQTPAAEQQNDGTSAEPVSVRRTEVGGPAANLGKNEAAPPQSAFAAAQNNPPADAAPMRIRKRGGGATPI
jgi:hypothetical protein